MNGKGELEDRTRVVGEGKGEGGGQGVGGEGRGNKKGKKWMGVRK